MASSAAHVLTPFLFLQLTLVSGCGGCCITPPSSLKRAFLFQAYSPASPLPPAQFPPLTAEWRTQTNSRCGLRTAGPVMLTTCIPATHYVHPYLKLLWRATWCYWPTGRPGRPGRPELAMLVPLPNTGKYLVCCTHATCTGWNQGRLEVGWRHSGGSYCRGLWLVTCLPLNYYLGSHTLKNQESGW